MPINTLKQKKGTSYRTSSRSIVNVTSKPRLAESVIFHDEAEICELLQKFSEGDREAFSALYTEQYPRLINLIRRTARDPADAEDIVHQAFLNALRHASIFDPSRNFSKWMTAIALNLSRNDYQKRRKSIVILFSDLGLRDNQLHPENVAVDSGPGVEELYEQAELQRLVRMCAEKIRSPYREIFVMREFEEMTYDEISIRIGCNIGTIRSRLHRARMLFAEYIKPHLHTM